MTICLGTSDSHSIFPCEQGLINCRRSGLEVRHNAILHLGICAFFVGTCENRERSKSAFENTKTVRVVSQSSFKDRLNVDDPS